MNNGPLTNQRIRLAVSEFGSLFDSITGSTPEFALLTDIQFELGSMSQGAPADGSQINSITAALKPASNIDATPVFSGTVAPGSSGWNSNFVNTAGNNAVPSYAQYSSNGSGANITCVYASSTTVTFTIVSGGTGYTAGATAFIYGPGCLTQQAATLTIAAGVITGITGTFSGLTNTTIYVYVLPAAPSYTLGVQEGGSYTWTAGANDLTLTNGSALVGGSNLVPSNAAFLSAAYTLSGLTPNTIYYYILGNATSISGSITSNTGVTFFLTGNATTSVTINGPASGLLTTEVYAASIGSNLISGVVSYAAAGSGASGTPTVSGGGVNGIADFVGGSGYTSATGVFTGVGTGAAISFTITSGVISAYSLTAGTGYTIAPTLTILSGGSYILSGLTPGATYFYTKGSGGNDTNLINGSTTLAANGFFTAQTSQVILTGTGGLGVTAQVQLVSTVATGSFVAVSDTVTFTGVAATAVTASLTGSVGWTNGTDQTCIISFSHVTTNIAAGAYWLLVTATTYAGNKLVLGSGNITCIDDGENTPAVVPGNIITAGAMYDGSGNYSQAGALIVGAVYYWQKNTDDATANGGLITSSGNFIATGTTLTLTGTASTAVTAVVTQVFVSNPVSGVIAVPQGVNQITVTGLTVPFVPQGVEVYMMGGSGDGPIFAQAVFSSVSQTGFIANFSGTTTSANYVLGYTYH